MKWFFATNEESLNEEDFFPLVRVAVLSAAKNTTLAPHMIYDGDSTERTRWLEQQGVTILQWRLTFKEDIEKGLESLGEGARARVRQGAFLRSEIPLVIQHYGIPDDYVLYTDCDVMFLRDVDFRRHKPPFFAASGYRFGGRTRFKFGGEMHYNSGVMLINVKALGDTLPEFRDYILNNGYSTFRPDHPLLKKNLLLSDEAAYNLFYKGRIDRLPSIYNWNPSGGISEKAAIVHFHGLKWTEFDKFLQGGLSPIKMERFTIFYRRSPEGYHHYVNMAKSY